MDYGMIRRSKRAWGPIGTTRRVANGIAVLALLAVTTASAAEAAVGQAFYQMETEHWTIEGGFGNERTPPACSIINNDDNGTDLLLHEELRDGQWFIVMGTPAWQGTRAENATVNFYAPQGLYDTRSIRIEPVGDDSIYIPYLTAAFVDRFREASYFEVVLPGQIPVRVSLAGTTQALVYFDQCVDTYFGRRTQPQAQPQPAPQPAPLQPRPRN